MFHEKQKALSEDPDHDENYLYLLLHTITQKENPFSDACQQMLC